MHKLTLRHMAACLVVLLAFTACPALATESYIAAIGSDALGLAPVAVDAAFELLLLSPDGQSVLARKDGVPVVISLADGTETQFWTPAEGLAPEEADALAALAPAIEPARTAWSPDGTRLAFAFATDYNVNVDARVWLADLTTGSIRPVNDPRIATEDDPAYFTDITGVSFHLDQPLMYFLRNSRTTESSVLSSILPRRVQIYRYDYANNEVSIIESAWYHSYVHSPIVSDGTTLATLQVKYSEATLLALTLTPGQAARRITAPYFATNTLVDDFFDEERGTKPAVTLTAESGVTAWLFLHESGKTYAMLADLNTADGTALDTCYYVDPAQAPQVRWTAESLAVLEGSEPSDQPEPFCAWSVALSPDGSLLALIGGAGDAPALYVVELATGVCGAVDLSAIEALRVGAGTTLQWEANRLLIRTTTAQAVCELLAK